MENPRHIIFYIHSLSGGGAERVCTLLANSFSKRDYKVTVITVTTANSSDYLLEKSINHIALSAERTSANLIFAIWNNLSLIFRLRFVIKKLRPDVVISFMTQSNIVASMACAKLDTIHIASERNHPPLQTIGRAWHHLRAHLYQLPRAVVSQTDKTNKWMAENTKYKVLEVIPNPVVYPLQSCEPEEPLPHHNSMVANRKTILAVGRLVDQKQFDSLVSIFSNIAEFYPDWDLVIVGEGPNREQLQAQIKILGLQNRILLTGKQTNMSTWYNLADIFVLTSKFEGYPNVLLEAMCYGVPCISYRCDTGPEAIIQHQHNGLLIPAGDEIKMTNGIRKLIENRKLRIGLGLSAKTVRDSHSIETITTQWESLIRSLE